jgi:hypothetical protein
MEPPSASSELVKKVSCIVHRGVASAYALPSFVMVKPRLYLPSQGYLRHREKKVSLAACNGHTKL